MCLINTVIIRFCLARSCKGLDDLSRRGHRDIPIFHGLIDAFLPGQPFLSDVVAITFLNVYVNSVPERLHHDPKGFPICIGGEFLMEHCSMGCGSSYGVLCRRLHALMSFLKPSFLSFLRDSFRGFLHGSHDCNSRHLFPNQPYSQTRQFYHGLSLLQYVIDCLTISRMRERLKSEKKKTANLTHFDDSDGAVALHRKIPLMLPSKSVELCQICRQWRRVQRYKRLLAREERDQQNHERLECLNERNH